MSAQLPSRRGRRLALVIASVLGVGLATTATVALVGSLAIADQRGVPLSVPAVVVGSRTAADPTATAPTPDATTPTASTAEPAPGPAAAPTASARPTTGATEPELVPEPSPIVVDDHGGDRNGSGSSSSSGSGSGSSSGTGGSSGKGSGD